MSDRGTDDLVLASIFSLLGSTAVGARIYAAYKLGRRQRHHDYLIYFGALIGLAQLVAVYVAVLDYGIGKHEYDLSSGQIVSGRKLLLTNQVLWLWATAAIRLSLLLFYLDLLRSRLWFRRIDYACIAATIAFFVAVTVDLAVACRPFSLYWTSFDQTECSGMHASEFLSACVSMILDFSITLIPMPALWKIDMPWKKRVAINVLFGFGFVVLLINVVRITYVANADLSDYSFSFAPQALLVSLETQFGIIVACLPTLSPLVMPRSRSAKDEEVFKSDHDHKFHEGQAAPIRAYYTDNTPVIRGSTWDASLADAMSPFGEPLKNDSWPFRPPPPAYAPVSSSGSPKRPPLIRRFTAYNMHDLTSSKMNAGLRSSAKALYDDVSLYGPRGGESRVAAYSMPSSTSLAVPSNTSMLSVLASAGRRAKGSTARTSAEGTESVDSRDVGGSNDLCITVQHDIEIFESHREDGSSFR